MRDKHQTLSAMRLSKKYGSRMVVRDVDLNVDRGEIVGLLGPNGAGKTTSFYMITGMIKPTKGHVLLDEMDIKNYDDTEKQQKRDDMTDTRTKKFSQKI